MLNLSRVLRHSPASAVAAIVMVALTLGAGTAIFAVVDAVLLTPPPFADPDALVTFAETPLEDRAAVPRRPVPYARFAAWRASARGLASLEAFDGTNLNLTEVGVAERLSANDATPGLLPLLGVSPALGRTFSSDDGGRPVAIVSDELWRGKLAGDPDVIGRQVKLGGLSHTIVGVLPPGFEFGLNAADIWRPLAPATESSAGARVIVVGRLAAGVSAAQLATALQDVGRAATPPARVIVTGIAASIAGDARRTLVLLAGAGALAILTALVNFAGLMLVRSLDRRREMAVRSALGARGGEVARQLTIDAAVLAAIGLAGGILFALWITPPLARQALEQFAPGNREVTVSWRMMAAAAALTLVAACACGVLPAMASWRRTAIGLAHRGATSSSREIFVRRALVAGQVALAFVLLSSMALVGRTLIETLRVAPGFDAADVTVMGVSLPRAVYADDARVASFYTSLQRTLGERLGPRAVAVVDELPLTHDRGRVLVRATPSARGDQAVVRAASPEYFGVMGIRLVAGRGFDWTDAGGVPSRVVLSRSLAQQLFGSDQVTGREMWLGADRRAEIVGVVADVKHRTLNEAFIPTVYVSALQVPSPTSVIVVRSSRPDVVNIVRAEVARLDRNLPVYAGRPMQQVVDRSPGIARWRVSTLVFGAFGLLAMVSSAIGLFGATAHDVARRRPELALRIALGAQPARIVGATFGRAAVTVGGGLIGGVVMALWAAGSLASLVPEAARLDIVSALAAAAVLCAAGAAAVLPAAWRAAHTDPLVALQAE